MGNDEAADRSKSDKASSPMQPLVPPPFGTPYTAIYPHGVYSHPSVSLVASPSTTDLPVKSSSNKDRGSMKKLEGFDGLAVSIGKVNAEIAVASSHSGENGAEGSSDRSDDNNESAGKKTQRKRSSKDTPLSGNKKAGELVKADHGGELKVAPNLSYGVTMAPLAIVGKPIGTIPASSLTQPVDFMAPNRNQAKDGVHAESWGQNDKEIKREKRKQSNRESARRSRLRKQAETEVLATKVESLSAENTTLRYEIGLLKENSEKLKSENSTLTEKLKNVQEAAPGKLENKEVPSIVLENFLSKIDKYREKEAHENSSGVVGGFYLPKTTTNVTISDEHLISHTETKQSYGCISLVILRNICAHYGVPNYLIWCLKIVTEWIHPWS